jgi:hypothetical protein
MSNLCASDARWCNLVDLDNIGPCASMATCAQVSSQGRDGSSRAAGEVGRYAGDHAFTLCRRLACQGLLARFRHRRCHTAPRSCPAWPAHMQAPCIHTPFHFLCTDSLHQSWGHMNLPVLSQRIQQAYLDNSSNMLQILRDLSPLARHTGRCQLRLRAPLIRHVGS